MRNAKIDSSVFEHIKSGNISGAMQAIKDAKIDWPVAAIFLGSGFLSGFLFKRYYRMFIISIAVGLVLIWGLDHFFHIIDWKALNTLIGDAPALRVDSFFDVLSTWISENVILAISFAVGAIVGIFI